MEEFDGTPLAGTYAGSRLKKFVERQGFYIPVATDHDGSESSEDCSESNGGSEDEGLEEASVEGDSPLSETPLRRSNRVRRPRRWYSDDDD